MTDFKTGDVIGVKATVYAVEESRVYFATDTAKLSSASLTRSPNSATLWVTPERIAALEALREAAERCVEMDEHPRSCLGWHMEVAPRDAWHDAKKCDCALSVLAHALADLQEQ